MITDCSDVVGGAFGGAPAGQRRREGGGLPGLFNDVERDFYAVISFKLKYKYNLGRRKHLLTMQVRESFVDNKTWPEEDDLASHIWQAIFLGQYLLYIEEDRGGCIANNLFLSGSRPRSEK
jgi:hypothetical protein